jgi:hypothetical protein
MLWTCPDCGRQFAKQNQWHSCAARTVDDHFQGRDARLRNTYDALVFRLEEFGPVRVDAVQGSINLISRHHFGAVTVQKRALRLEFLLDEEIESPRIVRVQRLGPRRVAHSVKLCAPDEVDEELLGWLRRAYLLQR